MITKNVILLSFLPILVKCSTGPFSVNISTENTSISFHGHIHFNISYNRTDNRIITVQIAVRKPTVSIFSSESWTNLKIDWDSEFDLILGFSSSNFGINLNNARLTYSYADRWFPLSPTGNVTKLFQMNTEMKKEELNEFKLSGNKEMFNSTDKTSVLEFSAYQFNYEIKEQQSTTALSTPEQTTSPTIRSNADRKRIGQTLTLIKTLLLVYFYMITTL